MDDGSSKERITTLLMYRLGDWLFDTTLKAVELHLIRCHIDPRLGSARRSIYAVSVLTLVLRASDLKSEVIFDLSKY